MKMEMIFRELAEISESVPEEEYKKFISALGYKLLLKPKIIGLAAGRMGYALQGFIMRLSHMGFNAYMIGDTSVPAINKADIVIVNSSSGETPTTKLLLGLAIEAGATPFLLSGVANSSMVSMASRTGNVLTYKAPPSGQIMKTLPEQFSALLFDKLVYDLIEELALDTKVVSKNHSILE